MKKLIQKLLKSCKVGRIVYEPIRALYRVWSVPHRRRVLKRNGPAVLKRLAEVFEKHGIPYEFPGAKNTDVRKRKKIGRNEPCPCGSGKKFKRCCLGKGIYD